MKIPDVPDLRRRRLLKLAGATAALSAIPLVTRAAADGQKLKIGMIGSGKVGSALGRVWAQAGHPVMFSSRNLDNDRKLTAEIGANAHAGTPSEAAAFGEVLVFAVPYGALPELGKLFRTEDHQGDREDHQEMHRLEKTFAHPFFPPKGKRVLPRGSSRGA